MPISKSPLIQPQQKGPLDNPNHVTLFAQTNFRNENRRFGIKLDDRRRHMYVIGKTGMGKSTMLENMIIQDIQAGNGLAVTDPHGDLVEKVIKYIPNNRINDVIYFNPADLEHPIAFNIFENVDPQYKNLISNGLVGVFKKIWADSWGPRLEYILINSILALLENPGSTLLGVTRMLVDSRYRKHILKHVQDPMVRSFWVNEYNNYSEKFRNEAIAPIQNKVGQFLSSQLIRNIVGQTRSSINMRDIMDSRKILLMNLSKGRIGEENSALLGAMMITKIQLAAMSRVDIPETERKDFYLYVDEFQNFSTESFANILSEARKYRLNIIMAHQYIEQLGDEVRAAVFGNAGTLVVFRVGATDAEEFEKEFEPYFMKADVVALPAFQIYLRLMIDGVASDPFSANTLPPIQGETDNRDKVIQATRERYSRSRQKVEESILRWSDANNSTTSPEDDEITEKVQVEEAPSQNKSTDLQEKNGKKMNQLLPRAHMRIPAPPTANMQRNHVQNQAPFQER
ncbi:MAG TPA: type IV secretion system DNA-binding domain-containing protein, partial [Patescibacteria group bacterium]|nr:type IV secretion system DNA-binding domain-containing protein [Patescibacteria group bacterium]